MDYWTLTVLFRTLERILDVGAGVLAIYLGFRLFLAMPDVDRAKGEIKLPGGISIYVSRIGPGVFFAAFGTILIGLSFSTPVTMSEKSGTAAPAKAPAVAATAEERRWSSLGEVNDQPDGRVKEMSERNDVLRIVGGLNGLGAAVRQDLPIPERIPLDGALHDAKLRLMQSVWDASRWGDFTHFSSWVRDHAADPPPPDLVQPVEYFRAGSKGP